jgi:hypothetical protein
VANIRGNTHALQTKVAAALREHLIGGGFAAQGRIRLERDRVAAAIEAKMKSPRARQIAELVRRGLS